jgi:formate dehydrogenase major subunit
MSLIHEIDFGTPRSKSEKTVTLTIDGVAVMVPEGTSIMRAAVELGREIPKLCATDMVEAFGSCRLCLVEIQGRNGTPASCTTPVAEGMVVHTQTDRLKRLRKGVMELYISEHPLDCLTCSANGDCELQDMAGAVGLRDVRYTARSTPTPASTVPILISLMSHPSASSARVACGLARRCKVPSR